MARKRRKHLRPAAAQAGTVSPEQLLRSRARRQRRKGEWRKAALTLRRMAGASGEARDWVSLGAALQRARRCGDAVDAFRQGMYLHKRGGSRARAAVVAGMILELDPADSGAYRFMRG